MAVAGSKRKRADAMREEMLVRLYRPDGLSAHVSQELGPEMSKQVLDVSHMVRDAMARNEKIEKLREDIRQLREAEEREEVGLEEIEAAIRKVFGGEEAAGDMPAKRSRDDSDDEGRLNEEDEEEDEEEDGEWVDNEVSSVHSAQDARSHNSRPTQPSQPEEVIPDATQRTEAPYTQQSVLSPADSRDSRDDKLLYEDEEGEECI
jgi:hypothetical protein